MVDRRSQPLIEALALVSPGTPLREGLDQVVRAKGGALVVIGDDPAVLSICTGGFLLDAGFSPQRLSELAKMDGAIILAADASRIARANVHLMPKSSIPTAETGTRHRTAERVARSIDVPVLSVSEERATIAVYRNDRKHVLQRPGRLVDQSGQALSTMQQFRSRFDQGITTLSTLEVEDSVSVRDVVNALQPAITVIRIADEVEGYLVELGEEGRLIQLQLEELSTGALDTLHLVLRDYLPVGGRAIHASQAGSRTSHQVGDHGLHLDLTDYVAVGNALLGLTPEELLDPVRLAAVAGLGTSAEDLDENVEPRGYRLLHRLPRLSDVIIDRVVERFGRLSGIMSASLADLEKVNGVGVAKARLVKDGLARMVEASILERYG